MSKTISVDEDYHAWVKAHNRGGETMAETLRRLTRVPHPEDVANLMTDDAAEEAKESAEDFSSGGSRRFEEARKAFADGDE